MAGLQDIAKNPKILWIALGIALGSQGVTVPQLLGISKQDTQKEQALDVYAKLLGDAYRQCNRDADEGPADMRQ